MNINTIFFGFLVVSKIDPYPFINKIFNRRVDYYLSLTLPRSRYARLIKVTESIFYLFLIRYA
jgi:hypothetical protein